MQANDHLEMSTNVGPALERNRVFAAEGGQEGAVVFPRLGLLVVTCLDPRVDPSANSHWAAGWSDPSIPPGMLRLPPARRTYRTGRHHPSPWLAFPGAASPRGHPR